MKNTLFLLLSFCLHTQLLSQEGLFFQNKGQWQGGFLYKVESKENVFMAEEQGFTFILKDKKNTDLIHEFHHGLIKEMTLKFHGLKFNFVNALHPTIESRNPGKAMYSYFYGNDKSKWVSGLHSYNSVYYSNVWNGIDLNWYESENHSLKYDWIVKPGANASDIKIICKGAEKIKRSFGELVIKTSVGDYIEAAPLAYQIIKGKKVNVPCEWYIQGGMITFDFPNGYDMTKELVIDPSLVFCTFAGSTADNWGMSATYDDNGNFYLGSLTTGGSFYPTTPGAFQTTFAGGTTLNGFPCDITVQKFNPTGSTLLYSTFIGGNGDDFPHSLIVDGQNLIIAGRTSSSNYPVTASGYDQSFNGGLDIMLTKLNNNGTALLGSTYLGGSGDDGVNVTNIEIQFGPNFGLKFNYGDEARTEVNIDNNSNIYLVSSTSSTNLPFSYQTPNTKGMQDVIIAKFNSNLSTLSWLGNYGGNANDAGYVLDFNKNYSSIYIAGGTQSNNLSVSSGVISSSYSGNIDGYIMKVNSANGLLQTCSYLGTLSYDQIFGIQVDTANSVYVTGQTLGAWPVTSGVYSNPNSAQFVSKLNANLSSYQFSTVFGDGQHSKVNISPVAFLVDDCGNIFISGWGGKINQVGGGHAQSGYTLNLPITSNAIKSTSDGSDFYFFVLDKNAVSLRYGSYFGENTPSTSSAGGEHVDGGTSRFSPSGQIYQAICANCSSSSPYPVTSGAYSTTNNSSNCNAAAVKLDFEYTEANANAIANPDTSGCIPFTVQFTNNSTNASSYYWNFGDGNTSTQMSPTHTYTTSGVYYPYLAVYNPLACKERDSIQMTIIVKNDTLGGSFSTTLKDSCTFALVNFTNQITYNGGPVSPWAKFVWNFGDGTTFTGKNPPTHKYTLQGNYQITLTVIDSTACNSPFVKTVSVPFFNSSIDAKFSCPDSLCIPANFSVTNQSINGKIYAWKFGNGQTSSLQSPTGIVYNTPGKFTINLTVFNDSTCNKVDSFSKIINVNVQPTVDFTLFPYPNLLNLPLTTNNLSTNATSYLWEFGDGGISTDKNPIYYYSKTGNYDVCLTAINGFCKDKKCRPLKVEIKPTVDITTGFSPNKDFINDYVEVNGYGVKSFQLKIYNRWGEEVYNETKQIIGKTWDGYYRGQLQEQDIYAYVLIVDYVDGTGEVKKGNVTLIK